MRGLSAVGCMALVSLVTTMGSVAAPAPALEDIRQLVADGQFQPALQKISLGLGAKGNTQRYELYMLKGECHVQQKAGTMAADAFHRAVLETAELEKRSTALAHELLIKRSPGMSYKPRTGDSKGQAIDVIKADSRKTAFGAMLADEMAANQSKIKQAEGAKALPPILLVIDDVIAMQGMELAATGKAEETKDLLKHLTARAKDLIADALKEMNRTVDAIDKEANTYEESYQDKWEGRGANLRPVRQKVWIKRGLNTRQMNTLQEIGANCDRISPAIQILGQGDKSEHKSLEALVDQSLKIRKQINTVLDEDYTRVHTTKPK